MFQPSKKRGLQSYQKREARESRVRPVRKTWKAIFRRSSRRRSRFEQNRKKRLHQTLQKGKLAYRADRTVDRYNLELTTSRSRKAVIEPEHTSQAKAEIDTVIIKKRPRKPLFFYLHDALTYYVLIVEITCALGLGGEIRIAA